MPIKVGTVAEFEALGFPKKTFVIGMSPRTASGKSSPDNLSQPSSKASTEPLEEKPVAKIGTLEDALRDGVTDVLVIGTPPSRKSAQRVDRVQLADEAIGAAGGRAAEEVTPGRDQWARLSTSCSENVVSFDTFPGRPFQ